MKIAVYCGSTSGNKEEFTQGASALGKWMGKKGHTLVYGGANKGLMGTIADSVLSAGGHVIGVLPNVPVIQARKHMQIDEYIETETMQERKAKMIELADAFIAMPGGVGTLDEITEILSLQSLEIVNAPIIFFNVNGYYEPMRKVIDNILENEFGSSFYFEKVLFSDDIDEIALFLEKKGCKHYNFYGCEAAKAVCLSEENRNYPDIMTPVDLYDALSEIWCADTCAPRMRSDWSPGNKTLGQCSITAFLTQDIFGGEVRGMTTENGNIHCYNVVNGVVFDLTCEQFGEKSKNLVYDEADPIQDRESADHFGKQEKRERYEYLKNTLMEKERKKKWKEE